MLMHTPLARSRLEPSSLLPFSSLEGTRSLLLLRVLFPRSSRVMDPVPPSWTQLGHSWHPPSLCSCSVPVTSHSQNHPGCKRPQRSSSPAHDNPQSRALRVIVHPGATRAGGGQGQGTASHKGCGWSPGRGRQDTLTEGVLKTNSYKSNSTSGTFLHFPHQGRFWGVPLPSQSLAVLSGVRKIKEPLGPAPALPSRAESLFIWVCKQFPPEC